MTLTDIKDLTVTLTSCIAVIAALVGIAMSVYEYKLKSRAETRQREATAAEAVAKAIEGEIKLFKAFTEMMATAHSRAGTQVSDKAVETILQKFMSGNHLPVEETAKRAADLIQKLAVINLPVGTASQDAAIAAIWELGHRYKLLEKPAVRALQSLHDDIKEKRAVIGGYLKDGRLAPR